MTAAIVHVTELRELWIHTGTACNLECPFCLEGSKPGDTRLQRVTLAELKPHLDAAAQLNVQRFAFTGGEPLIVKDIVKILEYALQLKPCSIFTNGTAPLLKRVHQLQLLKQQQHALTFRVSLDHPDEQRHDADRGWGNFKRAIDGMKLLHKAGFAISIARHSAPDEIAAEIDARFRTLLRKQQLPEDVAIIALPALGRPGLASPTLPVSAEELSAMSSTGQAPMCSYSRMLFKRDGALGLSACALVDDDVRFEIGATVAASSQLPVVLQHHRCRQCVKFGASLS